MTILLKYFSHHCQSRKTLLFYIDHDTQHEHYFLNLKEFCHYLLTHVNKQLFKKSIFCATFFIQQKKIN
jgi:hypothetical protein